MREAYFGVTEFHHLVLIDVLRMEEAEIAAGQRRGSWYGAGRAMVMDHFGHGIAG